MASGGSPDIRWAVRRFISAIAFLSTLVVVLGAAGCGQRFERDAGSAPPPADLAADAVAALEAAGSAHFDTRLKTGLGTEGGFGLTLQLEGDASATAVSAHGSVSLGGPGLQGRILVDEHDLWVNALGQWFHEDQGLADAMAAAKREEDGVLWRELGNAEGIRRNFDSFFVGEVSEGPEVDGVATWKFEGKLNAEGIVDFGRRHELETTDRDDELLHRSAEASKLVLLVGQEDGLPRRIEFSIHFTPNEIEGELDEFGKGLATSSDFEFSLELSAFGTDVEIDPPSNFRPLDALFEELFGGWE